MTTEQIARRKRNLILDSIQRKMEEEIDHIIENGKYNSIDELDTLVERIFLEYNEAIDYVKAFYEDKIDS